MDAMTPEEYQLLLELGGQNAEDEQTIKMMLAQAEQLRSMGAAPEMRRAGNLYVAPNPLEYLGALANQNVARQKQQRATDMQRTNARRQSQQNSMVTRGILNTQAPQQTTGPGLMPPQQRSPFSFGGDY